MDTVNDPYLRHLFDGDPIFNVYNKDATNLSVGAPGPDLLRNCVNMIQKATDHRLEEEDKEGKYYLFQYGITPGLWECREELSGFLSRRYGDSVRREHLIVTCGASHGLQLLLTTVLSPNGVIFVEEVTYMIALDLFKQFPLMKIVVVPMKDDVVDLDALEELVREEKKRGGYFLNEEKIYWAVFYTIPTFHNPTGTTLPAESCRRLVKIARDYSLAVVCDDVYNLLHYGDGFPPHRLLFYDNPADPDYKRGNVISNCSFSKILSPAIRVGWIECNARVVNILKNSGILRSGGSVNHYMSGVIASLLHLKIQDEYLDKLVEIYKERMTALCDTLSRALPKSCSYKRPSGGYFVWIHLPAGVDGSEFIAWCQKQYKVSAIPGDRFSFTGEKKNFLRLSIGFHEKDTLIKASETICKALAEYLKKRAGDN